MYWQTPAVPNASSLGQNERGQSQLNELARHTDSGQSCSSKWLVFLLNNVTLLFITVILELLESIPHEV